MLLAESRFLDVLPGFVLADERVPLIEDALHYCSQYSQREQKYGLLLSQRILRLINKLLLPRDH